MSDRDDDGGDDEMPDKAKKPAHKADYTIGYKRPPGPHALPARPVRQSKGSA